MRKNILYLSAFLLLSLVYFNEGIIGGVLIAPGDGMGLYFPKRVLSARIASESVFQLWNPYLFSGFPFLASIESAALYPPNWLALFLPPTMAFNTILILHYAGTAFFTFLYARLIGTGDFAAFAAGVVFAFLGYMAAHFSHLTMYSAIMWFPLLLYLFEKMRLGLLLRHALLAGLAIGMMVLAGHPQMAFNMSLVLGLFVPYHAIYLKRGKRARFIGLSALALFVGTLVSLPQLYSTLELIKMSPRADVSYKFFTAFSYPPHMFPSSIFPFLWGKGYGGKYWGPLTDYADIEGYTGILPLLVAVLAAVFMARRNIHARFFAIVGVAGFLLTLGKYFPLYKVLYHIPVFTYFRCPARHWLEVSMAVAVLFALGLGQYHNQRQSAMRKPLVAILIALITVTVVPLLFFGDGVQSVVKSSMNLMRPQSAETALVLSSPVIYIPLIFMALYTVWHLLLNNGRKATAFKVALVLLVFSEAFVFRHAFDPGPKASQVKTMCKEGVFGFLAEKADGRAAFLHDKLRPLQGAMCGIMMVDGFEQLVIDDYNSMLGLETSGAYSQKPATLTNNAILSMLNTKYIVVSPSTEGFISSVRGRTVENGRLGEDELFSPPFAYLPYPYIDLKRTVYKKVYSDPSAAIYENLNALPIAYPVGGLRIVNSMKDAINFMQGDKFDPRNEAVVLSVDAEKIAKTSFNEAKVGIKAFESGKVVLESESKGPAFIVLSEQYYPGWKAYIDGNETALTRANGVLKGVAVPEGSHEIVFAYRPVGIYVTFAVSAFSILTVCLLIYGKRFSLNNFVIKP